MKIPLNIADTLFISPTKLPKSNISQTASLVDEVGRLMAYCPAIVSKVEADLDIAGIEKKKLRKKDQEWLTKQTGLNLTEISKSNAENISLLQTGRPRMLPELVVFFLCFRGLFSGFRGKISKELISESFTLSALCYQLGLKKLPSESTILENCNAVSISTIRFILFQQIQLYFTDKLDSFKKFYIDSTSTKANSAFPTESGLILAFSTKVFGSFTYLFDRYKIGIEIKKNLEVSLTKIRSQHLAISMGAGKKNAKQKRKKQYKKILKMAEELLIEFNKKIIILEQDISNLSILPSELEHIKLHFDMTKQDILELEQLLKNTEKRIVLEEKVKTADKVLSVSDSDAAIISKGEREIVFGFKPNVSRSENGFIITIEVPIGNASDSSVAVDLVKKSIKNTGFVPEVVSFDDGYTSENNKTVIEELGVYTVSFSGSKGKKVSGEEEYYQEEFIEARNKRSMAESIMNELKNVHGMGEHSRRNRENVQKECLEMALANNSIKASKLRLKL